MSVLFGSVTDMHRLRQAVYRENVDPRELAIYTPADVALFVGIRPSTLKSWINGRYFPVQGLERKEFWPPILDPVDHEHGLLSFYNLAEAHVLAAARYQHRVRFKSIRKALDTLKRKYPGVTHPLIYRDFFTDGKDLFIKSVTETENLSNPQQLVLKQIMDSFLRRIKRDRHGQPERVYPMIKGQRDDKVITIIPGVSSGQPVIEGRGVPVFVVYGRYKTGEKPKSIARDFDVTEAKVRRAIEYIEKRPIEQRAA